MIYIVTNRNAWYDENRNIVLRANSELEAKLMCFNDGLQNYIYLLESNNEKWRIEFYDRLERLAIEWFEKSICQLLEPDGKSEILLCEMEEG